MGVLAVQIMTNVSSPPLSERARDEGMVLSYDRGAAERVGGA